MVFSSLIFLIGYFGCIDLGLLHLFLEFLYFTLGIDESLLSGIKWMAFVADVNRYGLLGRSTSERHPTSGAGHFDCIVILGVDGGFHNRILIILVNSVFATGMTVQGVELQPHEYLFPLPFFYDALEIVPAFPLSMISETVLREVVGADFF